MLSDCTSLQGSQLAPPPEPEWNSLAAHGWGWREELAWGEPGRAKTHADVPHEPRVTNEQQNWHIPVLRLSSKPLTAPWATKMQSQLPPQQWRGSQSFCPTQRCRPREREADSYSSEQDRRRPGPASEARDTLRTSYKEYHYGYELFPAHMQGNWRLGDLRWALQGTSGLGPSGCH